MTRPKIYNACDDYADGVRQQLAATEALLAGLEPSQRGTTRERILLLALNGLRSEAKR